MFLVVFLEVISYHRYGFVLIWGVHHFNGGAPPPVVKFSESLVFLLLNDVQLSIVRAGLNIGLVSMIKTLLTSSHVAMLVDSCLMNHFCWI